jgi:apolipoprotein N-acyltransferase
MRATNIGITAFVTPRGEVLDAAPIYAEATRVWQVSASAGDRTFYVRFGDWIAWLSLFVVVGTCVLGRFKHKNISE